MTITELSQFAGQLGAGATLLLLVALYGVFKGWWYTGAAYRAKEREAEEWKRLALRSTDMIGDAVEVAKR